METVNALGRPCPIPVIEAKKAIARLPESGGQVAVLVDDAVAQSNLEKLGDGEGYKYTSEATEDGNFKVIFTIAYNGAKEKKESGLVVAIGRDVMGGGSDKLGKQLMKSFIFSLTELDSPPKQLLFFNGGVHLTTQGSDVLDDLKILADAGCIIDSCGACLNFYELTDSLKIGSISNMYAIASAMADAKKLINL